MKMGFSENLNKTPRSKPFKLSELNRRATCEDAIRVHRTAVGEDTLQDIVIPEEYKTVEALLKEGCPAVFVTGNAGTGKSTLIRYLRQTTNKRLVVLAPTGVAALNAGGVTIHSFCRLPPKIHEDEDIKLLKDRKLYQKIELLIIDEVSMVRCDLMDSIDKFLQKNRSDERPFGGVQLLLIGDLFQLPPVVPRPVLEVLQAKGYKSPYFFSSFGLQESSIIPVELTFVYRQEDRFFIDLLNDLRIGENTEFATAEVNRQCYRKDNGRADITLTCTNAQAGNINNEELQRLPSMEYAFTGKLEGRFSLEHDKLPSPMDLRLKTGAHVMFTKNDRQKRWVNGTVGIVQEIDEQTIRVAPLGKNAGTAYDVRPETWENYQYAYDPQEDRIVAKVVGSYTQYPLTLGWAVTIHKSQGKTLDSVLIDLGTGAFAHGQVYVALSRCRSIDGIRLVKPIRATDVICDPVIKRFYLALSAMMA